MALLVGGMFCDEVEAAVDDTCRGPIMLMRSCGFTSLPQGRGCRGTCPGYVGLMLLSCLIGVLVTGHGR